MQKNHKRVGRFDTAASGVSGTGNKAAMHVFMMASPTTVHGNESNISRLNIYIYQIDCGAMALNVFRIN